MTCSHCGLKLSDPFFISQARGTCPNCGSIFEQEASEQAARGGNIGSWVREFWTDLQLLLLKPHTFFRRMPRDAGLAHPLAFALIAHWIGRAMGYLWASLTYRAGEEMMRKWMTLLNSEDTINSVGRSSPMASFALGAKDRFLTWFWGTGSVIADPFTTLIMLMITSFFVYLGAKIFVGSMIDAPPSALSEHPAPRHEVTYESALRIIAYGSVASIFMVVPWVGAFISIAYALYISVVGAKEVYQVGSGRALVIVLFPKLLLLGIVLGTLTMMMLVFLKFFGGIFS